MTARGLFDESVPFDGDPTGTRAHRLTLAGRVAEFFRARPGQWIDGREVMAIAGAYGWRTRISDCRRPPFNMQIDNRQRRVGHVTISEYRYRPATTGSDWKDAA